MRKTIAKRLTESKTTVPHFYLTVECEIDNLLNQRKELNAKLADSGIKISVNDFIIRASGLALKKVPAANVQFAGDKMYWYERADISMAVAIDGGLVTPVIRGADQMGLADIATTAKDLALKARDGKLMPEDYAGGTFLDLQPWYVWHQGILCRYQTHHKVRSSRLVRASSALW